MTPTPSPLATDSTGALAPSVSGADATPVISAGEQRLSDYLAMPTQHILDQLRQQTSSNAAAATPSGQSLSNASMPANPGGAINPVNPSSLISPVINALGTLGTGQFAGTDPTSMLNGITNAFSAASGPVQQALSAVQQGWLGESSAAAATKTNAALANGADVATQATGLQHSLSAAAADVAQARVQLIAIINEFEATVAAIGINIIFPWGWAAVLAAAAQAVTQAAQVVTETQTSLAAQASAVSAIGAPVAVAALPQLGGSMAGQLSSALGGSTGSTSAMSMLSPLMYAASAGISPAMSAASAAGNAGGASGAATGTLADATDADPKAPAEPGAGKSGGHGGPVLPVGGGASGASGGALVSRVTSPSAPAVVETATAAPSAAVRPAAAAMPMTGAGAMGAPLSGAGHANGAAHTAASYLHTSDQGGKVVKDSSTVAPPVIGEADPNDAPDIELRI